MLESLYGAIKDTLKDKTFWKWELGSMTLYALPAVFRLSTGIEIIPVLNAPYWSPSKYIPTNLVEKLIVNAFFPGGAGGVAGETFISKYLKRNLGIKEKYLSRLGGAMLQYTAWTLFQYRGYFLDIIGKHGANIFESPEILPFNALLAALSIFTPDIIRYANSKLGISEKLSHALK